MRPPEKLALKLDILEYVNNRGSVIPAKYQSETSVPCSIAKVTAVIRDLQERSWLRLGNTPLSADSPRVFVKGRLTRVQGDPDFKLMEGKTPWL